MARHAPVWSHVDRMVRPMVPRPRSPASLPSPSKLTGYKRKYQVGMPPRQPLSRLKCCEDFFQLRTCRVSGKLHQGRIPIGFAAHFAECENKCSQGFAVHVDWPRLDRQHAVFDAESFPCLVEADVDRHVGSSDNFAQADGLSARSGKGRFGGDSRNRRRECR